MKYVFIIPILLFVILTGLICSCTGTVKMAPADQVQTTISNSAKINAIQFYKEISPLAMETQRIIVEWYYWQLNATQKDYDTNVINKLDSYISQFKDILLKLSKISAPADLQTYKDKLTMAVNKAIETAILVQKYATTGEEHYAVEADAAKAEYNNLTKSATAEWERGMETYGIEPSDIIK